MPPTPNPPSLSSTSHVRIGPRPHWPFRTPLPPSPIEPFELAHPEVPPELAGLRILHIADTHIERVRPNPPHHTRTLEALRRTEADLIVLTGDFMTHPGDEAAALHALSELADSWRTRFGAFAIGGNHDSPKFLRSAAVIPGIRWLRNESVEIPIDLGKGPATLRLVGSGFPESLLSAVNHIANEASFTMSLVHYPTEIYAAAQLNLPIVFSGHTHGGQIRPHKAHSPHTSCDLPPGLVSGVFRLKNSLLCISRGLGSAVLPIRFNCPAQAPLYTLRTQEWDEAECESLMPVRRW